MKAISVKYQPATNFRPSRLTASDLDGNNITVPYDDSTTSVMDAYAIAAMALCKKMGWTGTLAGGELKNSFVFVFVPTSGDIRGLYEIK